ncbi:MAG: radical SAM protein [Verrucomicrobia bacterium]|nr:radical SAM protein [Verrucomicrobiota bacterium]
MTRKPQFTTDGIRHATINGHRFHLRLTDPSELNPLWIDGQSPPLLLDQVAGEFVALLIDAMWKFQQGVGDESPRVRQNVVDAMYAKHGRFFALPGRRVTRRHIDADLDRIFGTMMRIAEGACPVEAGLDAREIRPAEWNAPARMDLALTYRCNLNCPHCYTGGPSKELHELAFDDWLRVYEVLWRIGVPNVVFTGGEPTLRDDLVRLVAEADEFVTGVVTNGVRLAELAGPLHDASLDYAQVTIESHDAAIHNRMVGAGGTDAHAATVEGIKRALGIGLQVITNTTLTKENASSFADLLRFGKDLGLRNMSCNTLICSGRGVAFRREQGIPLDELRTILERAIAVAQDLGVNLQWYSPTCYLHLNPIELGFGAKGCSAAAHNMTVQPDGTVLPCQSWPDTVGNILTDPWERIWRHPICDKLRAHGFAEENADCVACIHNEVCAGACPLEMMDAMHQSGKRQE